MGAQLNGPKRPAGKRGKKAWRSIDTSEVESEEHVVIPFLHIDKTIGRYRLLC